ncbi:MAG TPA: hypothetical protein VEN80_08510 [Thermoplasmata archaeon]|nr:hypothetical protein [Thermoplasmata archaeon]
MPLELPEVPADRRTWRFDGDISRELEAMGIVAFPADCSTAPNTTIGGGGRSMRVDVRRYKAAAKTTDTSTTTTTTITMIRAALLFLGGGGGG